MPAFFNLVKKVGKRDMLKITMNNSQEVKWQKEEYDNYMYDGKFFIIIKNGEWIGFYNLNAVVSIVVK